MRSGWPIHWPIEESKSLFENPKLMQRRSDPGSIPPPSSNFQNSHEIFKSVRNYKVKQKEIFRTWDLFVAPKPKGYNIPLISKAGLPFCGFMFLSRATNVAPLCTWKLETNQKHRRLCCLIEVHINYGTR